MAGKKLSPRQRMINMMYLVLTAMLALNVSQQVLDAFVHMEEGFQQSISIVRSNNRKSYDEFVEAGKKEPDKVGKIDSAGSWLGKATIVRNETRKLYNVIDSLKKELVIASEGKESKALAGDAIIARLLGNKGDTNTGTHMLVGSEERAGEGYDLQQKIATYKDLLLTQLESKDSNAKDSAIRATISGLLETKQPQSESIGTKKQDWVRSLFYNTPIISDIALMSKIQLDILSCESAMLNHLFVKIGADDFKFSSVQVVVRSNTDYVLVGSEYKAEIFLAAYNSDVQSTATIGGAQKSSGPDGKILYSAPTGHAGLVHIPATISYVGPKGQETQPFEIAYQVIEPMASVSPTKMNVLYSGVPNPLRISVGAGVSADKIKATINGESLSRDSKDGGNFTYTPPAGVKTCDVVVSAEVSGKWQSMGTIQFRVKPVPPPTPRVDGISGRTATKSELGSSQGLRAVPPQDFEFDAKFTITGFNVAVVNNEGYTSEEASTAAYFTEKQKRLFSSMKAGSQVTITEIKATGPSGPISLPDLVVKVK